MAEEENMDKNNLNQKRVSSNKIMSGESSRSLGKLMRQATQRDNGVIIKKHQSFKNLIGMEGYALKLDNRMTSNSPSPSAKSKKSEVAKPS